MALADGTVLRGVGFGAMGRRVGELVFSTAMTGYTEALTDPSYRGQLLVLTYPLVGNYGVPPDYESERIQVEGLIVSQATEPSHYRSQMSLNDWLAENGVPGIMGVDTRFLVRRVRESGVMGCALHVDENVSEVDVSELKLAAAEFRYDDRLFEFSSVQQPRFIGSGSKTIALIDFGAKEGLVRNLVGRGFRVAMIPHSYSLEEVLEFAPSGIVLSNGPGNPAMMRKQVEVIASLFGLGIPVLGVCLGHQLIGLAAGGRTYKMRYGHRGINKPCRDMRTGRLVITLQNHGYAVDAESLEGTKLKPWFVDCDDRTVEGLFHESEPIMSVQFHPEGSPGPQDASYVFDIFSNHVEKFA